MSTAVANAERGRLLERAFQLEVATVAWNILEGIVAVTAGVLAGSVALVGFGVDSFIETASAAVVGWRMRVEHRATSAGAIERIERSTARAAGVLLLVLAVYLVVDAGRRLLGFGSEAQESRVGIAVTAVSLLVMPALAWAKLKIAGRLNSGALRADAYESVTCAWLSVATLAGLGLNAWLGWSWADPLAALVLVPLIVREGLEGLRGEHGEDEDERPGEA